jgi:protein-tyrosine phosphatase
VCSVQFAPKQASTCIDGGSVLIDTHSHLLPWVDHGCPDLATSVLMARAAAVSGIGTVVCTPHLTEMAPEVVDHAREVIEQVKAAVASVGIRLKLLLGFEVDLAVAAECELEELRALTIEGSSGAIVLEMPYEGWPCFLEETLFRLSTGGLRPVLAHPERNDRIQRSPELLDGCIRAGAVVQATAASLSGEFGRGPERAFRRLLSQGAIGLLASDAHAYRKDGWTLTPLLENLRDTVREQDLAVLVKGNPQRLVAGQPLRRLRPEDGSTGLPQRQRRIWGR